MSRFPLTGVALLASALAIHAPAFAQTVNYEDLQATFGEPVTTSVTGKPQRASEAPAAITIITRAEIERSPARDIPGLLKIYAGIDVNRWTAGQSDIAVRGGVQVYNPSLLVMVDGRQVYLDHYGMTDWNLIGVLLEDIQQVELVRGPASAIFGFNAASGVINIITRGVDKPYLNATAEGGDHGYARFGLSGVMPMGERLSLRLSAEHQREDERAIPAYHFDPAGPDDNVQRDAVSGTVTAKPSDRTIVEINAGYATNRQLEYVGGPTLTTWRYRSATAGAHITHDMGWGIIDGQLYSNWLKAENPYPLNVPGVVIPAPSRLDNDVVVGKTSLLARLSSNATVRIGGEYRSNRLSGNILYSPVIRYDVWSTNVMIDVHPTDRIALTGAARIDHLSLRQEGAAVEPIVIDASRYDQSFTTTSFNASMLLSVGRDGQVRINGGRGYQSPSLLAFGIHALAQYVGVPLPIVVSGDPAIRPAEVWSAEIGYAQPILPGLKVDASLYYSKAKGVMPIPNQPNALTVGPTGSIALTSQITNLDDLTAYGAEFSLTATTGRWSGQANYSWTKTLDNGLSAQNGVNYFLNAAAASPRHKVNATATYDTGKWFATIVGRYMSATQQLGAAAGTGRVLLVDLPDTVAVDAKISYRITKTVSVDVAGDNLTKARGAMGAPIWADRRVRAGLRVAL